MTAPTVYDSRGHQLRWDRNRIEATILKETQLATKFYGIDPASKTLAEAVAYAVEERIRDLDIAQIQAPLVRALMNAELIERGYIDYANLLSRVGTPVYDSHMIDTGDKGRGDNANLQENAETSHKRKADKICKEQYLYQLPKRLANLHRNADIHIHDLEYFGTRPFCQDWDLRYFFYYGLMPDGIGSSASVAGPAKKPEVAMLHSVKALGSAQTNFAGGQGYYNFLTFTAPYLAGMEYYEIKQYMQMFVYEMTQMMVARGGQVVFSSVQLSPGVPDLWKNVPCVYKGKVWDGRDGKPPQTYGMFEREVRLSFKALMEVMLEGDYWGKPFNFPKPEISIEPCFISNLDNGYEQANPREVERVKLTSDYPDNEQIPSYRELYLMAFQLAAKYGTPYFDNQLPAYRQVNAGGISCYQCCAYQFSSSKESDTQFEDKIQFKDGSHFSMGASQVVTINLPRIAYQAEGDVKRFIAYTKDLMDQCIEIFRIKKDWMDEIQAAGKMPFATQRPRDPITGKPGAQAVDFSNLVYTIGVVGINEVVQSLTGEEVHESDNAIKTAIRIMLELKNYTKQLSKTHGMTIAFARTPAETTAQRFAVADLLDEAYFDNAIDVVKGNCGLALTQIGETTDLPVYYTNGTHVRPNAEIPLSRRIDIESKFFPLIDGGNIMHIWMGEESPDPQGLMDMTLQLCKNTNIGYFAFTRDFTVCRRSYRK